MNGSMYGLRSSCGTKVDATIGDVTYGNDRSGWNVPECVTVCAVESHK